MLRGVVLALCLKMPLLGIVLLAVAAGLWPRRHACPAPVRLETSSYRTHDWQTRSCAKCARAPARRIASVVLAAWGILGLGAFVAILVLSS
jgi:hypothetical protein